MPKQSLSSTRVFSVRHNASFLPLGISGSTSIINLGDILNSKIIIKRKKGTKMQMQNKGTK